MRSLNRWVDRFCQRHPRFGIPNLMLYIAIANIAVYFVDLFSRNGAALSALLGFSLPHILKGEVWRLVTFILLPQAGDFALFRGSGAFFVVLSAYFYYWIGALLEREWGVGRFTFFYLSGVVLNILFGLVTGYATMYYINLSLFMAFAVLYPDMQVLVFYILPVKVKWLGWIDAALFLWEVVSALLAGSLLGALLPILAVFNFLVFFWEEMVSFLGYRKRRFQHQHSRQTIQFKKAVKDSKTQKGYIHKCAVCGKTDTDYPDLEFRYCSHCNGYYCYCMEHINNHVHVQ